jgi:ribonuclease HI
VVVVEVVVAENAGSAMNVVSGETTKHTFTVDASYNRPANTVGIGILVQATDKPRKRGPILSQHSEAYQGVSASSMEEFAIFRALEIASEMECQFVKVRSDCNSVRTRLKKDHKDNRGRKSANLHGIILRLAKQFTEVKFAYVPRRKNHIAHKLARQAAREMAPQANPLLAAHDSET